MRIFILGAGYVGTALMEHWREPTYWASTTTPEKAPSLELLAEKAFILKNDQNLLREIVTQCEGMVICVAPSKEDDYERAYLQTALYVQEALQERSFPLYLLYTSSTSIYGEHQGNWVDETSLCLNQKPQGQILKKTEDIYLSLSSQYIKVCVLRLAGIYGPQRSIEKRALSFSGKPLLGHPHSPTNHVHLEDITGAISFCFDRRCEGVYNLANDDHRTRHELYSTICARNHVPLPLDEVDNSRSLSNCKVSNQKIRRLNFSFKHPTVEC